jgi:ornithine cyclodeaminase/alanine dehydrogenase-like protein (mu-crystallin family)
MTLHVNESEVRSVLTMTMALEAVEDSLRKQARGDVVVQPRRRFELPKGFYHYMAAADYAGGFVAEKQYTYVSGKIRFLVLLYEMATGDLLAQIEADYMGQLRTGAASGVATKFMARRDARIAAIIGTGGQARTQLEAVAGVRKLELARAYGRDVSRREKFCSDMAERLKIPVYAADSAAQAIEGADIICTATTASQPVVTGPDIATGMHINAIGVNHAHKQELDEAAVGRADIIAVDSIEQSRQEAGDLIMAFGQDESKWSSVKKLADIVDGKIPGRSNDTAVTLFKSNGIASWDLAVAVRVLALARKKGLGRKLPLWTNT